MSHNWQDILFIIFESNFISSVNNINSTSIFTIVSAGYNFSPESLFVTGLGINSFIFFLNFKLSQLNFLQVA